MQHRFQAIAATFTLAATTALTPVALRAQQPSYPQQAPPPTIAPLNNNDNYAPVPPGYYGPAMTQQDIEDVAAGGIGTPYIYARKGFTEGRTPDGARVGLEYHLDPNGQAYFQRALDLNNPQQLDRWNQDLNVAIREDVSVRNSYQAGLYAGPGFYTGLYRPCWGPERGYAYIGLGRRTGLIIADPYLYLGRPLIIEPYFGFGFGRGLGIYERGLLIERERLAFRERFNNAPFVRNGGREVFNGNRQGGQFNNPGIRNNGSVGRQERAPEQRRQEQPRATTPRASQEFRGGGVQAQPRSSGNFGGGGFGGNRGGGSPSFGHNGGGGGGGHRR